MAKSLFISYLCRVMFEQSRNDRVITAFTGHRNYNHEADDRLRRRVLSLYDEGCRIFRVGMAEGFDLVAGEIVVELMVTRSDIILEAYIPYVDFYKRFGATELRAYNNIIAHATLVRYASESYHAGVYNRRNNMLVEGATNLVAWCNGGRSGTRYTLRRALRRGCRVDNIYPHAQSLVLF